MTHATTRIAVDVLSTQPAISVRDMTSLIIEKHGSEGCVFGPNTMDMIIAKYGDGQFTGIDPFMYGNDMHDLEIVQDCVNKC